VSYSGSSWIQILHFPPLQPPKLTISIFDCRQNSLSQSGRLTYKHFTIYDITWLEHFVGEDKYDSRGWKWYSTKLSIYDHKAFDTHKLGILIPSYQERYFIWSNIPKNKAKNSGSIAYNRQKISLLTNFQIVKWQINYNKSTVDHISSSQCLLLFRFALCC
jgi:hypothetical protein